MDDGLCCGFRYLGKLSVGTMVMGYDDRDGFSIYYVDNEGVRSKGKRFAVGSGSTYAYRCVAWGERSRDMHFLGGFPLSSGVVCTRAAVSRDKWMMCGTAADLVIVT